MDGKTLGWMIGVGALAVACTGTEVDPGGTGGAGGVPGGGGAGGAASCSDLIRRADAELQAAQSCNVALNRVTCVDTVLSLCNCPVIIDMLSLPAAQSYLATKAEIEARKDCLIGCPAVLCRVPGEGRCQPPETGVIGTCVDGTMPLVSGG